MPFGSLWDGNEEQPGRHGILSVEEQEAVRERAEVLGRRALEDGARMRVEGDHDGLAAEAVGERDQRIVRPGRMTAPGNHGEAESVVPGDGVVELAEIDEKRRDYLRGLEREGVIHRLILNPLNRRSNQSRKSLNRSQ